MNKKLVIGALLLAIGYFGFDYIVMARLGYLAFECSTPSEREIIAENKISNDEKLKMSSKIYTCAMEKQSSIERLIIKVPENWINPPTVSQ